MQSVRLPSLSHSPLLSSSPLLLFSPPVLSLAQSPFPSPPPPHSCSLAFHTLLSSSWKHFNISFFYLTVSLFGCLMTFENAFQTLQLFLLGRRACVRACVRVCLFDTNSSSIFILLSRLTAQSVWSAASPWKRAVWYPTAMDR